MKINSNYWLKRKWSLIKTLLWDPRAAHGGGIGSSVELADFLLRGHQSVTGANINSEVAMRISGVNLAVRKLSESVGQLPLIVYRRTDGGEGKERALDHPLYNILKNRPNIWQTSIEWRKTGMVHCTLQGNFYCWKNRVRGEIRELIPIMPDRVEPEQLRSGAIIYKIWPSTDRPIPKTSRRRGSPQTFRQEEIMHVRNLSSNGIVGRSTLADARDAMGLTLAEEGFAAKTFGSGATPSGVLEHPEQLGADARKALKDDFDGAYGGEENSGGTLVLEEGMKWKQVSISPQDAQFLESRRFGIAEIARFFNMPLHMLGELERSTNNNIEQQSLEFVVYTLVPWLVAWEQVFTRDLFDGDDSEFFAEFIVDGLLRGDTESRALANEKARLGGWKSVDDIRRQENLNKLPNGQGERYLEPLNMRAVSDPLPTPKPPQEQNTNE